MSSQPIGALAGVLLAAALAVPTAGSAQRVELEIKAGAAVGNFSETSAGLELVPGPSFGAVVEVWPTRSLAAYGGVVRASFGCEEGFCENQDVTLTSQGFVLGGRWAPGFPWVRAGLAVQTLDIDASGGSDDSGVGVGFEVGVGAQLNVGRFGIRPGLTYLRHATSTELGEGTVGLFALELGGSMTLGHF